MIRIEPLGTDHILPAILVGFELSSADDQIIDHLSDAPPWLIAMDQQAGGMAMSYPCAVGAVLRLDANSKHAICDPAPLIRGFKLMAEDSKVGILQNEYPVLSRLVGTWGKDYSAQEIKQLDDYTRRFFLIPQLRSGLETFVRSEPCDPLDYFAGWSALSVQIPSDKPVRTVYKDQTAFHVDDSNVGDVILSDECRFDDSSMAFLLELSMKLARRPDLCAILMWENSD